MDVRISLLTLNQTLIHKKEITPSIIDATPKSWTV